jgi:hypothetical protein
METLVVLFVGALGIALFTFSVIVVFCAVIASGYITAEEEGRND